MSRTTNTKKNGKNTNLNSENDVKENNTEPVLNNENTKEEPANAENSTELVSNDENTKEESVSVENSTELVSNDENTKEEVFEELNRINDKEKKLEQKVLKHEEKIKNKNLFNDSFTQFWNGHTCGWN